MPVCIPEAWLQGCLHLRVELLNFVRKLRESMWHDCASLLSRLLGSGHVRPNYAFPNQTKWLLLVSISMCSSPMPQVGVHTNNAAHSVLPFKKSSATKMWFEHKSNNFFNISFSVVSGLFKKDISCVLQGSVEQVYSHYIKTLDCKRFVDQASSQSVYF